jgi:hypothetical protein
MLLLAVWLAASPILVGRAGIMDANYKLILPVVTILAL